MYAAGALALPGIGGGSAKVWRGGTRIPGGNSLTSESVKFGYDV